MRRGLRFVLIGCALVAIGCTPLWPAPDAPNGRYPEEALTTISPVCKVVTEIVGRLKAMLAAAQAEGVGLVPETESFLPPGVPEPPRIESCYRSYEMQVWWRDYYCTIDKCGLAANPGTSKHGFGRAVDLQDQLGQLTFESPGYLWLAANAARFGFLQPPSVAPGGTNEEAWHWEASP